MFQHADTRPQVEVVGIAEHDGCVQVIAQLTGVHGLGRAQRTHRHEDRCGDAAVVGMQFAGACVRRGIV